MHATDDLAEADRLMTICNACRYCEGLCAVFPAMEMRRTFADGDLNYLANLCHQCGACYSDCQYSPPHEFDVNVPRALAEGARRILRAPMPGRARSSGVFERNGLAIALVAARQRRRLHPRLRRVRTIRRCCSHRRPGAFYRLMPHNAMAVLFGAVFLYAIVALVDEPARLLARHRRRWRAASPASSLGRPCGTPASCAISTAAASAA